MGEAARQFVAVQPVRFVTEIDLPDMLAKGEGAGCELVRIDTPPG